MYSTFINYTEEDETLAKRLYADLLADGVRPWMAAYDTAPGDDHDLVERQAMENSEAVVILLTKKYTRNPAAVELGEAAQKAGKKIVPVMADTGLNTPAGLPEPIKLKKRYGEAVAELIATLPGGANPLAEIPALQRGNEAYFLQDFDEALEAYSEVKEESAVALNSKAATLNALRRHKEALELLNRAIELETNTVKIYLNRSLAYTAQGQHENALKDDNRALELEPESPRVLSSQSMTLFALERYDEAQQAIEQAIKINPDEAHYFYQLGLIHLKVEKYEQALTAFQQALDIEPDNSEAQRFRQVVLGKTGRIDEALAEIDREIKKNPRKGGGYVSRSLINFYLDRFEEAVKDATMALERGTNQQPAALYNRAIAHWKLGHSEQAGNDLLKAIGIFPDLGTAAGIRVNADSEATREAGLAILESLQASGRLDT